MTRQYRILIAEDNVVNLKLINRILTRLNHIPESAHNGHEVLQLLKHTRFDFILMDIQMPGMDGLETTRQIVATIEPPARPIIIAMTANAMNGDKEICLAAGMDDYLSKPIIIKDLEQKLCEWGEPRKEELTLHKVGFSLPQQLKEPDSIINLARLELLRTLESNNNALNNTLHFFFAQCQELLKKLHQEHIEKDTAGLFESAHSLKGACLNYGAVQVAELCKHLELLLHNRELHSLPGIISQIEQSFGLTSQLIKQWLHAQD